MENKFCVPESINLDAPNRWCPGCGHGIIVRLIAEAVEELGLQENVIMVEDVACGEFAQKNLKFNSVGAAHGRPIITAAGVKRARPNAIVIAHPGDGSAYSIGIESTIHCALRNENILALVVNNSVFGMTGGQMSPTTLPEMKTTSSPKGRDPKINGSTFDVVKVLGHLDIAYLARGSVDSPAQIIKTGKLIKKALQKQINGEGFCLVEVLSPCPTNWNMQPVDALKFMKERQESVFKLGEFVDKGGNGQ